MLVRKNWIGVLALVGAVVFVGACGGQDEKGAGESAGGELAAGEPPLTVEDRIEATKPKYDSLPANYPSDLPRYPGVTVTSVKASGDSGLAVGMESGDDFEKVASFFADTFASEGWTTDIRNTSNGRAIFADKGNRNATAMVRRHGDGAAVNIIVIELN